MVGRPVLGRSLRQRGRFVAEAEEMAYLRRGWGVVPGMLPSQLQVLIEPWNQEITRRSAAFLLV